MRFTPNHVSEISFPYFSIPAILLSPANPISADFLFSSEGLMKSLSTLSSPELPINSCRAGIAPRAPSRSPITGTALIV